MTEMILIVLWWFNYFTSVMMTEMILTILWWLKWRSFEEHMCGLGVFWHLEKHFSSSLNLMSHHHFSHHGLLTWFGSFILHLLLGLCWDCVGICWDRSQQSLSQTLTNHPSGFILNILFSVPNRKFAITW